MVSATLEYRSSSVPPVPSGPPFVKACSHAGIWPQTRTQPRALSLEYSWAQSRLLRSSSSYMMTMTDMRKKLFPPTGELQYCIAVYCTIRVFEENYLNFKRHCSFSPVS